MTVSFSIRKCCERSAHKHDQIGFLPLYFKSSEDNLVCGLFYKSNFRRSISLGCSQSSFGSFDTVLLINLHKLLGQLNIAKWAFLVAQTVKSLPVMQETQVWFLGWKDPLEKEMATHFSILAWRIPWTEELGELQSMGSQRVRHDWANNTHTHTHTILPTERKAVSSTYWFMKLKFCFHRNLSLFLNLLGWVSFQISYY